MTRETTPTGADTATTPDPDLPPAPRSWPHIARRARTPGTGEHPTRPLPVWPQRTTGRASGRRDIYRGRDAGRCTGRTRGTGTVSAAIASGHPGRAPGIRTTGRHRAVSTARSAERVVPDPPGAAGPSDLERRARRYERRMTRRADVGPRGDDSAPGSPDPGFFRWSQRTTPVRPTRFPTVQPGGSPLPGVTPARHAPDRHLRRSPGRVPTRRPASGDDRLSGAGRQRRRAARRGAAGERRRLDTLIGTALTTVLIALPLGPVTTAGADTGESAPVARSGAETAPATGTVAVSAPARNAAAGSGSPLLPGGAGEETPFGAVADTGTPDPAVADPAVFSVQAAAGTWDEAAPAAEPAPTDTAAGAPTGSSRAGGCATGSNSGSSAGSGAACRVVVPLLRDLVRELVRLTPRPAPPCPCPDRA